MTIAEIKTAINIKITELDVLKLDLEEAEAGVGVSDRLAIIDGIKGEFQAETITGKEALYKLELLGL